MTGRSLHSMKTIGALAALVVFAGCAAQKTVHDVSNDPIVATPARKPVYNATVLESAVQCLNSQLNSALRKNIVIATDEIKDRAGTKVEGGREFVITSLSRLNADGRITVSDWTREAQKEGASGVVLSVDTNALKMSIPDLTVRGAITQSHTAERAKQGGGINLFGFVGGGQSEMRTASSIALDLRLIDTERQRVLTTSSNVISISSSSVDSNFYAGKIGKGDFDYDLSWEQSEGNAAAVRTLIDMCLIELLGKHFGLDYGRCINPQKQAITQKIVAPAAASQSLAITPPTIALTSNSTNGFFKKGELVKLSVVASEKGYLNCFYTMGNGSSVKIFPNRYVRESLIPAKTAISVPGDDRVRISAENTPAGGQKERILCAVSRDDPARFIANTIGIVPTDKYRADELVQTMGNALPKGSMKSSTLELNVR